LGGKEWTRLRIRNVVTWGALHIEPAYIGGALSFTLRMHDICLLA